MSNITNKLYTLDKKLMTSRHKFTPTEIKTAKESYNFSDEELNKEINNQMYTAFLQGVAKNIPVSTEPSNDGITYQIRGYVLSEKMMYELILECLEMDDKGKEIMVKSIRDNIGI